LTEAATQALEYDLTGVTVSVASNSGKTKECARLIRHLRGKGHRDIIGLVAQKGSPVQEETDACYVLSCGGEDAVAATKSVVEQALFYDVLFRTINGKRIPDLAKLGGLITETLKAPVPREIVEAASKASMLYWAGRNDGAAEELTLKSNEIARRKSDFLEGTYAVHGIEEVMDPTDLIVVVDPFPAEEEKFAEVLVKGVGAKVDAISSRTTSFPTFVIPDDDGFSPYLQLAAGWNILVEGGVGCGINLDKPQRARKVGNEFPG
jgi:glucosamine--fructose-6-phosphate aminotransferase (isomerizing)